MSTRARATLTRDALLRRAVACAAGIQVWPYSRHVAAEMGVSPSTVSRHLRGLAERGALVIHHHGRKGLMLELPGGGRTAEP